MCRMLAARAPTGTALTDLLGQFRKQAQQSATGPEAERHHRDGWGIVAFGAGRERLFVRRPANAATDDAYESALQVLDGFQEPLVIVHFRNASVGKAERPNTHPFMYDGWWFAHNGTVRDSQRLELRGVNYEGNTDSERYFRKLVRALRVEPPPRALPQTAQHIASLCSFSSLTSLLTDGKTMFGYRCLGGDLDDCGTVERQREYYNLGVARKGEVTFITQEPTHLGAVHGWTDVPEGSVVEWRQGNAPRVHPAVPIEVAAARRTT